MGGYAAEYADPRWLRCEAVHGRASKPGDPVLGGERVPAPWRQVSRQAQSAFLNHRGVPVAHASVVEEVAQRPSRDAVSWCWDSAALGGRGNPRAECLTLGRAVKQSALAYVAEAG